jgi:hypothetical protein
MNRYPQKMQKKQKKRKKITVNKEEAQDTYDACEKRRESYGSIAQVDASPTHLLCEAGTYES